MHTSPSGAALLLLSDWRAAEVSRHDNVVCCSHVHTIRTLNRVVVWSTRITGICANWFFQSQSQLVYSHWLMSVVHSCGSVGSLAHATTTSDKMCAACERAANETSITKRCLAGLPARCWLTNWLSDWQASLALSLSSSSSSSPSPSHRVGASKSSNSSNSGNSSSLCSRAYLQRSKWSHNHLVPSRSRTLFVVGCAYKSFAVSRIERWIYCVWFGLVLTRKNSKRALTCLNAVVLTLSIRAIVVGGLKS